MHPHSPQTRATALRRAAAELIFAWGSVVSAAWYGVLTVLGRPPLIDDHLTVTALVMLCLYLASRCLLDALQYLGEARRRSRP